MFVGCAEVVVLTVALVVIVELVRAVPFSRVDVDLGVPVRSVTDGGVVVRLPEAFAAAMLLESRETEPSWIPLVAVLDERMMVEL